MTDELNQANKKLVYDFWAAIETGSEDDVFESCLTAMTPDMPWNGPDPINALLGPQAFARDFWLPFRAAFSNPRRESHLFFGGRSNGRKDGGKDGRMWVCGTGYFTGIFAHDWLGIPANSTEVRIRWGEFCLVENGRIAAVYFLLDLVDLMRQAGFDVLPADRGAEGVWPAPREDNGVLLTAQDGAESEKTLDLIRRFLFESLNVYDEESLESMGVANYFHPGVQWYGPGGIGACDGLREFEDLHQRHWLHAFPDRSVQDLDCLFAESGYTGGSGWAAVHATHKGQYLDYPATGRRLVVNGLDFWRREGDQFTENWVFVDMVHLFRQFGVDLFDRIRNINTK